MTATFRNEGPLLVVPSFRRALVLAPHPDDEVIGCGGTIALLSAAGCRVSVTFASDGSDLRIPNVTSEEVGQRRRSEAVAACAALDALVPEFLGFPDGALLTVSDSLTDALSATVRSVRPEGIFVPWPLDGHDDHRALPAALAAASVPADTEIWSYEVWSGLPANRMVDITGVGEQKRRALGQHRTPASVVDTSAHLSLQRWRSAEVLQGRGEAEAFMVLPFATFSSLVVPPVRFSA